MTKLLIMGANPETVSLINKAKEMGIYTIVTDNNPNAYAKKFANKAENIDATDVERLVNLAKAENVNGVVVGVAEALLPSYCDVCEALNMPSFSTKDVFASMTNKDLFKRKCIEYGVSTIEEYTYDCMSEIVYPVIVKPVDSCSSKGITVCNNQKELERAIEYALSFSICKRYIIEKYMNCDEIISYYAIQDGNPIFVGICDRYTCRETEDMVQLPISYIYPSRHIKSYLEKADMPIKNMLRGMGIKNGTIFLQGFIDEKGTTRIYESGYRLNGAQEHIIISRLSGIDAKELYINYALYGRVSEYDLEPLANPSPKDIACKLSPLVRTGTIGKIEGLDKIEGIEEVISVNPSYEVGDEVVGNGTLRQIVCRFFIICKTACRLKEVIEEIYELLKVSNKEGEDMLFGRFDTDIVIDYY